MISDVQRRLLSLVAHALFERPTDATIDAELLKEAQDQTVKSLITTDYKVLAQNLRVINAHARLTQDLSGIPFVSIKGYASAYYYPCPTKRTMGDVDFFVAPDQYQAALAKLLEAGYQPLHHEHARHENYNKDGVHFELHSEIKGIPNGKDGIKTASQSAEQRIRLYLSDIIETAKTVKCQQGKIVIPDDFHHGLVMLLHVAGHMINDGGIGLRHLCDWAVFVDRVDLSIYKGKLEEVGLWTFARQLTAVCSSYLGLRIMPWAGEWDNVFLSGLIEDILSAGNFSRKDGNRNAAMKLAQADRLVSSIVTMTRNRFEFCDKHPILLPIGFLLYGYTYLKNRITGHRQWMKKESVVMGRQRKKLYEHFKLFVTETEEAK